MVAKVFSFNGGDIGRRLVPEVVAYRRYSTDYLAAEDDARKANRGIWRESVVETLGVACIITAPPGIHAPGSGPDATAAGWIVESYPRSTVAARPGMSQVRRYYTERLRCCNTNGRDDGLEADLLGCGIKGKIWIPHP